MEKCAEQQRLLFLGMCSLEDRKRICDEKIMDLYNFERITYLLEAFGFEEYKFVFEMKYKDLLLKLADIVEQNLVWYLLHPTDSCKFGLLLALYTGLRIGELCALRWSWATTASPRATTPALCRRAAGICSRPGWTPPRTRPICSTVSPRPSSPASCCPWGP